MLRFLTLIFLMLSAVAAEATYRLGQGYHFSDSLHLGAYFSSEYEKNDDEARATLDDIALFGFGRFNPTFSYLIELEAVGFYSKNLTTHEETRHQKFHYERAYVDIKQSETFSYRIGRQITPMGYWNLEPINVLRDTTSNPILSQALFPKFVSGIDIYGYLPHSETTSYHFFIQETKDLDTEYINISTDHFMGLSIENESSMALSYGGSIGAFNTVSDDKNRFVMFNIKYDAHPYLIQMESIKRWTTHANNTSTQSWASYLQGLYHINDEHALVMRLENIDDDSATIEDQLGVLGYSYRPIYPLSIKTEYQWHQNSADNTFLISLSMLF